MSSARGLQIVTGALGVLAIVTGVMAVAGGPAGMLDGQATTATVDSEVRFMAVYWLAYGVGTLYLVPRIATAGPLYRAWLAVMFASGVARAISFAVNGAPHPVIAAAILVELLLPPVLYGWQRQVAGARIPDGKDATHAV
jgi:hypothetical protein